MMYSRGRATLLSAAEDLEWLRDVHAVSTQDAVAAILYGNEDSPSRVEVYWRDHYRSDCSIWEADEEGVLRLRHGGSKRIIGRNRWPIL